VGWGTDPGWSRAAPRRDSLLAFIPLDLGDLQETHPGESIAADGSVRVLLGAAEMAALEGLTPGTLQLRPAPAQLRITLHPLQLHIPVESPSFLPAAWETGKWPHQLLGSLTWL